MVFCRSNNLPSGRIPFGVSGPCWYPFGFWPIADPFFIFWYVVDPFGFWPQSAPLDFGVSRPYIPKPAMLPPTVVTSRSPISVSFGSVHRQSSPLASIYQPPSTARSRLPLMPPSPKKKKSIVYVSELKLTRSSTLSLKRDVIIYSDIYMIGLYFIVQVYLCFLV